MLFRVALGVGELFNPRKEGLVNFLCERAGEYQKVDTGRKTSGGVNPIEDIGHRP